MGSSSFGQLETAPAAQPGAGLRIARNAVGMALVALANPMVWHDRQPVILWAATWLVPAIAAAAVFALLALFFTKRARAAWPRGAILIAWVLLALVLAGYWMTYLGARRAPEAGGSQVPAAAVQTPSQGKPAEEDGPWMQYRK